MAVTEPTEPETPREKIRELERVAAFSDGVFAIAATLLVLSIDVPAVHASLDAHQWSDVVQPVFTYFLSFAVVGRFWLFQHQLLGRMSSSTMGFAVRSLVFLAFVAFLPAPTELLANYRASTATVVIYAVNVIVLSVLARELARYADAEGLTTKPAELVGTAMGRWGVFIGFGLSIPVAFVDPRVAAYLWLLAAILPRVLRQRTHRSSDSPP